MKDFNYYETTINTYPRSTDYTTCYVYDKGVTIWQGSYEEYRDHILNKEIPFPKGYAYQKIADKEALKEHVAKYNEEYNQLLREFKEDLFEEFGVSQNPKREQCYSLAWEDAHAHGLESVYDKFSKLVDLIK
jgi:hypothetical protein